MKCKICKQKTDWDKSYGYREFIVCPNCFWEMVQEKEECCNLVGLKACDCVMTSIFTIGKQIKRIKERESAE